MKITKASPENYYHYNRFLKFRSREFRRSMTKGERVLWSILRRKNIFGFTFLRQRPVLEYVADFMCKELYLIIESDGIFHETDERKSKDKHRDKKLGEVGFTVMRYKDWEIINRPEEIEEEIRAWVKAKIERGEVASPRPPSKGESGSSSA